jgi:HPt (histidine-containing phosphotransfer) domain-containing protein
MKGALFKPEALEVWKEINPQNWSQIVNELIEIFLATGPEQLVQLRDACQREDLDAVRKLAHGFKSGCANVGAESCYIIMCEIEYNTALKKNEINSMLQDFEPQFKRFLRDVVEYRKGILAA